MTFCYRQALKGYSLLKAPSIAWGFRELYRRIRMGVHSPALFIALGHVNRPLGEKEAPKPKPQIPNRKLLQLRS